MAFDKTEKPADIAEMSIQMLKSCKKEIARYGFSGPEYLKFLSSVKAMRNGSVMAFPMEDLEKYRKDFIAKHEHGLNDSFVLEKYSAHDGKHGKVFIPRAFWDKIMTKETNVELSSV